MSVDVSAYRKAFRNMANHEGWHPVSLRGRSISSKGIVVLRGIVHTENKRHSGAVMVSRLVWNNTDLAYSAMMIVRRNIIKRIERDLLVERK